MNKQNNSYRQEIIFLLAIYGNDKWNKEHGTDFKFFEEARNENFCPWDSERDN